MALLMASLGLIRQRSRTFGPADAAYAVSLGAMLLGRWLEFRGGAPLTADGEPATAAHLRRYVFWTTALGAAVWAAAAVARRLGWVG
jgi:hypothetical protein